VIIGPNGAGKSTVLKTIFGLVRASTGTVRFDGRDITNSEPDALVPLGLSFVPQEFNVFTSMTVQENLEMGAYIRRDDIAPAIRSVYAMFPDLEAKRGQKAGELSGGQRQMVAMGRALMSQPKLLLLDEPSAGLSPRYVAQVFEQVTRINNSGVGILMVEQNARHALAMASRGFVIVSGENRFTDTGPRLLADPEVGRAFLGG
jgi:branched-chain amino acid transport system ATP-binding protein